jgi:hypothetical protein
MGSGVVGGAPVGSPSTNDRYERDQLADLAYLLPIVGPPPSLGGVNAASLAAWSVTHSSEIGAQTGIPQQVLTAQSSPAGHSKFGPHGVSVEQRVLPGMQRPPGPGSVVTQTQSGLPDEHSTKVSHVAPAHSGFGPPPQRHVSGFRCVPVGHTGTHSPWHVSNPSAQSHAQVSGLNTSLAPH